MTITETAASGTPAVVTRIAGHLDAVAEGRSGLLVEGRDELVNALDRVIRAPDLRDQHSAGAVQHAADMTWEASAFGVLEVLTTEATRVRARSAPR